MAFYVGISILIALLLFVIICVGALIIIVYKSECNENFQGPENEFILPKEPKD